VTMKIGIGLFTAQVPPGSGRTFEREYRDVVELTRLAEQLGFDSVWVSEHHGAGDGYLPSLLPMLAGLATVTERVQLGTGVLLTPFHHPLRLAEDAAVVDLLSGGRLVLGLGLGWREEEFRMFDVPIRERVARTVETVEVLRRAWTGERFSFEGRVFSFDDVLVTPAPADGRVPIYLGGHVEAAVRRAGRHADGFILSRTTIENAERTLGPRRARRRPAATRRTSGSPS
jgi:probable F420-dependent oxidoreductase